jgi:Flp pilus assembly protein TadD
MGAIVLRLLLLVLPALSAAAAPGYVDDALCARCHTDIARSYREVGMARSFYRPDPAAAVEAPEQRRFFHAPSRRWYELEIGPGGYRFRQWQIGADGRRVHELELPVEAVLGSGHHARTYLYRTPSDELFQLPVAWYAESARLGMAPGFDRPDHAGITRAVRRECLSCHNAYPNVPAGSDLHGEVHAFPTGLPQGTGCQRCHGPGTDHLALAEGGLGSPEAIRAAIVQPGKLPARLRDDVCHQCHWQPSVAIPGIRRIGRPDYGFRAGELLAESLVRVDVDEEGLARGDRFEINHHPYRLEQSPCFTASAGRLSCLTCHDPHAKVSAEERVEHFRAACRECHAPGACAVKPEPVDCVGCHMPKRRPRDVVQVVMTDHRIQRPPARPEALLAPRAETEPVLVGVEVLPGPGAPAGAEAELYRALAAVRAAPVPAAVDRLHQFLAAAPEGQVEPALDLANARLPRRDFPAAERELRAVLAKSPGHPLALEWLGIALNGQGRREEAAAAFGEALAQGSRRVEARFNLAVVRLGLGQPERASALLEEAVALRPNFAPAWAQLARARLALDQPRPAVEALRRALAIDGSEPRLYQALAQALRRAGEPEEAERVLADGRVLAFEAFDEGNPP